LDDSKHLRFSVTNVSDVAASDVLVGNAIHRLLLTSEYAISRLIGRKIDGMSSGSSSNHQPIGDA